MTSPISTSLLRDLPDIDFVAIDVETTLNGDEDTGIAHPMHPKNWIVALGVSTHTGLDNDFFLSETEQSFTGAILGGVAIDNTVFCGHNISFDLMYLYRSSEKTKALLQRHRIWDTQLAEYILTGQESKFSSLDDLCRKYRLPLKDDKISEYFKAGMGSDKIPREELSLYLRRDIENTFRLARAQFLEAKKNKQLALIWSQMEALHATTEMMFNGLQIDKKALDDYSVEVVEDFCKCKENLEAKKAVEDINSPKQWSQFFFGGKKKVKVKEAAGLYKNGNTKFMLVEKTVEIPKAIAYVPDPDKVSEKTGQVSVDDSVLKDMLNHTTDMRIIDIIKSLLEYRELSKQLSTYVQGLGKHVISNRIHGKLNHTATVTGRLSSTNPNLQNISNNTIKKIFTSRFEGGLIVEVDFNQLEVVALAHITKDEQLIEDIKNGVDIHSALYEGLFGRKPTKEERKPFKARTFQLIYGAGARAISKQAGCPLEEAQKFIGVFYKRYPSVALWHESFAKEVESYGKHLRNREGLLDKHKTSVHTTTTGRMFRFIEYFNDRAWASSSYSYSPTEMKNYPVQGLATGDCVPLMLGILFRKFVPRDDVKIINTIHDSILFDVRRESAPEFILDVLEVLRNTHKFFEKTFGHELALPLNASAGYGVNWYEMIEAEV